MKSFLDRGWKRRPAPDTAHPQPVRHPRAGRRGWPLPLLAVAAVALAAAAPDPPRGDLRVVVISDLNGAYGSTGYRPEVHDAVRRIRDEWRPDLVLAAGDLVAGQQPSLPDDTVRAMWAAFDSAVAAPLRRARIPFAFTLGNHDGSAYPAHRRDRALAVEHWRAPARRPGLDFVDSTRFPVHYSFVQGDAFVLVWDASNEDAVDERHDVRIYLSGHHHAYYPGRRGALELLSAGALGEGPRPYVGSAEPTPRTVTVLDFFAAGDSVAYTTYALDGTGAGGARRVDPAALPPVIRGVNGYTVRRDLPDTLVSGRTGSG